MENTKKNLTQDIRHDRTSETKARIKAMRDKDREQVKGIFRYYEIPNGVLEFVYSKYKEDPVEKYSLRDGHMCTIPLGVAKHLNKNGWYPVHSYRVEEDGRSSITVGKKVRRFGFQSLDFIDEADYHEESNIIIEPSNMIV